MSKSYYLFTILLFFLISDCAFGQVPRPFGVWRDMSWRKLNGAEFDGLRVFGQIKGLDTLYEQIQSKYYIDSLLFLERPGSCQAPYVFFIDNWNNNYNLKIERCKGRDCTEPELHFYQRRVKGVYNKKNKNYHLKIFQEENDLYLGECSDYLIVTIEETKITENSDDENSVNGFVSKTNLIKQFYVYLCY